MKYFTTITFTFYLCLLFTQALPGQAGTIDPTFGQNGKTVITLGLIYQLETDLLVLPDGKMLVAGIARDSVDRFGFLIRLDNDGKMDSTFGVNGLGERFKKAGYSVVNQQIIVQSDGKMLSLFQLRNIATSDQYIATVVRHLPDGTLDLSFGAGGQASSHFGLDIRPTDFLVSPDGKIIVGGTLYTPNHATSRMVVLRFLPNGAKDNSFNNNGKLEIDYGPSFDYLNAIGLQSDGKIVLAGETDISTVSYLTNAALVRIEDDGSLDTSFGLNGKSTISFGDIIRRAYFMKILPDGKLLLSGYSYLNPFPEDLNLFRLNSDGSPDTTFGDNGLALYDLGGEEHIGCLNVQPDGKILLSSLSDIPALVRCNPDGTYDNSFGNNGVVRWADINLADSLYESMNVAFQADGKILMLNAYFENSLSQGNKYFAVIRLNANTTSSIHSDAFMDISTVVYPNPVTHETVVNYSLPVPTEVEIVLYDMTGRQVQTLLPPSARSGGAQQEMLHVDKRLPVGIYFMKLKFGEGTKTVRIVKN